MEFPTVIAFYSKGTPYEEEVQNLIVSCEEFGLSNSIEGIESFGSWELNCAFKPFFILKKLEELKKPVLWVDADGVFMREPNWIEAFESDLAVRFHDELDWAHPSKVITSTLFVRPSEKGKEILRRWMRETQKSLLNPKRSLEFWDQIALRDALKGWDGMLESIPLEYAKIFDHPSDCSKVENPVIEHFQASRRFKKQV